MKMGLTRKQDELLRFIRKYHAENEVMPSYDEMTDGIGLRSKSGVHRLVDGLIERGRLRRIPNRARALQLCDGVDEDGILVRLRPDQAKGLMALAQRDFTTPDAIVRELVNDLLELSR